VEFTTAISHHRAEEGRRIALAAAGVKADAALAANVRGLPKLEAMRLEARREEL
jgi:hypothetical protein